MAVGIMKIDRADRTALCGKPVKVETLLKIIELKIANPLASQELLAELSGFHRHTIATALNTPFAKERLAVLTSPIDLYRNKLSASQGDAVTYYGKSIVRGHSELRRPKPSSAVLTNARECANTVSKITGLLTDKVLVRQELSSHEDYADLAVLETELEDIGALTTTDTTEALPDPSSDTTQIGEGESPTTPPSPEK